MIVEPTIEVEAAMNSTWDAVVIGAGPAGSMAARELARRSVRTLLVDSNSFPRNKVCGCCINRRALSALDAAGLGDLTSGLNAVPLQSFQIRCRTSRLELNLPGGMALSRSVLDAALLRAAIDAGCDFLGRTTARLLPMGAAVPVPGGSPDGSASSVDQPGTTRGTGDLRVIALEQAGRQAATIEARVVLVADGLPCRSVQQTGEFPHAIAAGSWIGLGANVNDGSTEFARGVVHMAVGRAGYVGAVRLEDGSLNLAAAVNPAVLRASGAPASTMADILESAGFPLPPGLRGADCHGTVQLTRRAVHVGGHRVFLLGDAAGYVEPFTGEGLAWALVSAGALAPLVVRGVRAWSPALEQEWSAVHRRAIRDRQFWCRGLARLLRSPAAVRGAMCLFACLPRLGAPILRRLNEPVRGGPPT